MPINITSIAMTARNNRIYSNMISYGCISYLTTNLNDFPNKFMTHYTRIGRKGIFSMINAYIRTTNPSSFNL